MVFSVKKIFTAVNDLKKWGKISLSTPQSMTSYIT